MKTCGVYAIFNVKNGKCYVGNSRNIEKRWRSHRQDLTNGDHHNSYLQRSWNKYGADAFSFQLLEAISDERLFSRELFWISFLGAAYNLSVPNAKLDGWTVSDVTRQKMARIHTGKTLTPEARQKVSEALKQRVITDETRKKLSERIKSHPIPMSEEGRQRQINSAKRKRTPEERERLSKLRLGKPKSEEHRRKISEANRGHINTDEHRAAISAGLKGKPWTEKRRAACKDKTGEIQ